MKKLISIALASALALAACGGSSGGVAATVNDTELTVSDVEALPYESSGTMEPAMFAQYLTVLIQLQILEDAAAAEFSVEPAEDTVDAEIEELLAQQGGEITLDQIAGRPPPDLPGDAHPGGGRRRARRDPGGPVR